MTGHQSELWSLMNTGEPGLDLMFSCCTSCIEHAKFSAEPSQQRHSKTVLTTYAREKFLFSEALSALILHIS